MLLSENTSLVSRSAAALGLALALFTTTLSPAPASAQIEIGPWPDACSRTHLPARVTEVAVPTVGTSLDVLWTGAGLASKQIVIVLNGNSYSASQYNELIDHLVQQGFIVANAHRPAGGDGGDGAYVLDVIGEVLGATGISAADPDLRIGLLGHSRGGLLAVDAADLNLGTTHYPIRALVLLSPKAEDDTAVNAFGMPAYLSIYGTQDEDLTGYSGTVKEAFRGYDQAGNESSTTCNTPPGCLATNPSIDKTMVYVSGADHAGLIGESFHAPGSVVGQPQNLEYIDADDQLCISKAYSTAFFRWQLGGDSSYKGFIRDEWRPLPFQAIHSFTTDGFGQAAGADLRMHLQISPKQRKVMHSFRINDGSPTHSPGVQIQHAPALSFDGAPTYLRHNTGATLVGWPMAGSMQFARWTVPMGSRVGSTYTHFSIRLGQVEDAPAPFNNPVASDRTVHIGFVDGSGNTDLFTVLVPYPDRYNDGTDKARTAMSTFRIAVEDFDPEVDLDNVASVLLIFPGQTHGTILVDSLEWHRD